MEFDSFISPFLTRCFLCLDCNFESSVWYITPVGSVLCYVCYWCEVPHGNLFFFTELWGFVVFKIAMYTWDKFSLIYCFAAVVFCSDINESCEKLRIFLHNILTHISLKTVLVVVLSWDIWVSKSPFLH